MKSGFYYTNPKPENPIKPLNLLFKYNFTIKLQKNHHNYDDDVSSNICGVGDGRETTLTERVQNGSWERSWRRNFKKNTNHENKQFPQIGSPLSTRKKTKHGTPMRPQNQYKLKEIYSKEASCFHFRFLQICPYIFAGLSTIFSSIVTSRMRVKLHNT